MRSARLSSIQYNSDTNLINIKSLGLKSPKAGSQPKIPDIKYLSATPSQPRYVKHNNNNNNKNDNAEQKTYRKLSPLKYIIPD